MQAIRTRFSVIEDLDARDLKTPRKSLTERENSFKMTSLRKPKEHSISQINVLDYKK